MCQELPGECELLDGGSDLGIEVGEASCEGGWCGAVAGQGSSPSGVTTTDSERSDPDANFPNGPSNSADASPTRSLQRSARWAVLRQSPSRQAWAREGPPVRMPPRGCVLRQGEESGSQQTRRRREPDSNHRSLSYDK